MNLDVVYNAKRNMVFGAVNRIVAIICPFITRTTVQYILGEQYLGLNSLFSSILSVLSLTDLGFGTAIVYSMYQPVAENNTELVNSLLYFYKRTYAKIGLAVLGLGICLLPFLQNLITGSYPSDIDLRILYLIYLCNTVMSYFMFAYLSSLIVVYQRDDINSRTNMVTTLLFAGTQILLLVLFKNYLLFSLTMPVFTVANNLRIAYVVKKMFPQYHCEGNISKEMLNEMKRQVKGTFISKICSTTRNSFDSICASAFLGLSLTAIYNNYYYLISSVTGFMGIFITSLTGGIGNHVATRGKNENFEELKEIDFIYMWVSGWSTICILCLSQPFMQLWMGKRMMLDNGIVILMCIYFYLLKTGDMRSIYSNVNGLWWQHRWRSIVEAAANVFLNIFLARYFGIYGIVVATILTISFIQLIWGSCIVFQYYFGIEKIKIYFLYHIFYAVVTIFLSVLTYFVCSKVPYNGTFAGLMLRAIVCLIFPNIFYFVLYFRLPYLKKIKTLLKRTG